MTSSRKETIGGCELYLGDCREILPALGLVDAVVTDPPFSIPHEFSDAEGRPGKGKRKLHWDWDDDMSRYDVARALTAAFRKCNAFVTFCGLSQSTLISDAASDLGFTAKPAVWVKECPPPAGEGNWWPSGMQMAVYGYKSGAYFGDDNPKRSNVFVADAYRFGQPGKNGHPTQTPLSLMERFVRAIVPPSGLCLDPFVGSGTTAVACARFGRRCIGIERNEKWFDIACQRVAEATAQPDMIEIAKAPKPKQLSLMEAAE